MTADPQWEIVLDIDYLNEEEGANWSFCGAELLYPDFVRALIFLSRGGDACEIREFDLINKTFIRDGFFCQKVKVQLPGLMKIPCCWHLMMARILSRHQVIRVVSVAGSEALYHKRLP